MINVNVMMNNTMKIISVARESDSMNVDRIRARIAIEMNVNQDQVELYGNNKILSDSVKFQDLKYLKIDSKITGSPQKMERIKISSIIIQNGKRYEKHLRLESNCTVFDIKIHYNKKLKIPIDRISIPAFPDNFKIKDLRNIPSIQVYINDSQAPYTPSQFPAPPMRRQQSVNNYEVRHNQLNHWSVPPATEINTHNPYQVPNYPQPVSVMDLNSNNMPMAFSQPKYSFKRKETGNIVNLDSCLITRATYAIAQRQLMVYEKITTPHVFVSFYNVTNINAVIPMHQITEYDIFQQFWFIGPAGETFCMNVLPNTTIAELRQILTKFPPNIHFYYKEMELAEEVQLNSLDTKQSPLVIKSLNENQTISLNFFSKMKAFKMKEFVGNFPLSATISDIKDFISHTCNYPKAQILLKHNSRLLLNEETVRKFNPKTDKIEVVRDFNILLPNQKIINFVQLSNCNTISTIGDLKIYVISNYQLVDHNLHLLASNIEVDPKVQLSEMELIANPSIEFKFFIIVKFHLPDKTIIPLFLSPKCTINDAKVELADFLQCSPGKIVFLNVNGNIAWNKIDQPIEVFIEDDSLTYEFYYNQNISKVSFEKNDTIFKAKKFIEPDQSKHSRMKFFLENEPIADDSTIEIISMINPDNKIFVVQMDEPTVNRTKLDVSVQNKYRPDPPKRYKSHPYIIPPMNSESPPIQLENPYLDELGSTVEANDIPIVPPNDTSKSITKRTKLEPLEHAKNIDIKYVLNGVRCKIQSKSNLKLESISRQISKQHKFHHSQIVISKNGINLVNSKTLSDLKITNGTELDVNIIDPEYQFIMTNNNDELIKLRFSLKTKVSYIKEELNHKIHQDIENFRLTYFMGNKLKMMRDNETIDSYQLNEDNEIYVRFIQKYTCKIVGSKKTLYVRCLSSDTIKSLRSKLSNKIDTTITAIYFKDKKLPDSTKMSGIFYQPGDYFELETSESNECLSDKIISLTDFAELEHIGEGTYGNVVKMQNKTTKEIIAAKLFKSKGIEEQGQSFMREVESLFALEHPCIVKLKGFSFDIINENLPAALYMEYVDGFTLQQVLKTGGSNWTSTRKSIVIMEIAQGMRYIHSKGIIHRDLKPGNILLTKRYEAKICDFGESKFFEHEDTMTNNVGTLQYQSPEMMNGEKYDQKCDVYSFGVILFYIITGNYPNIPFPKIAQGQRAQVPPNVVPFVSELIQKCWSQNPNERPSFDEIINIMKMNEFSFFEDTDTLTVEEKLEQIEKIEEGNP